MDSNVIRFTEKDIIYLVKECVNKLLIKEENLKKGEKYSIPTGLSPDKYKKILSKKYNVSPDDFRFDGVRLVYTPVKKKKDIISKPDGMPVDEYYETMVLPNNPELARKEKEYPDEDWRPVQNIGRYFNGAVDYGSYYEVSNYGRLKIVNMRNALRSDIVVGYDAPTRNAMQFHLNGFGEDGERMNTCPDVKYIVADAWLEPHDPREFKVVHIDGDYHNNKADNLKWVLRK